MKSRTTRDPQSDETPAQQTIQQRAYDLYLRRGQEQGHELEDWLQAEREMREQQGHQKVGSHAAR